MNSETVSSIIAGLGILGVGANESPLLRSWCSGFVSLYSERLMTKSLKLNLSFLTFLWV